MNYYAEMEQSIDQLTGTLRAVTAERDALRAGIEQADAEIKRIRDEIARMTIKRTTRDTRATMAENGWKQALIDLLLPRLDRVRDLLTSAADRAREQAAAGQAEEGEGGGKAT